MYIKEPANGWGREENPVYSSLPFLEKLQCQSFYYLVALRASTQHLQQTYGTTEHVLDDNYYNPPNMPVYSACRHPACCYVVVTTTTL